MNNARVRYMCHVGALTVFCAAIPVLFSPAMADDVKAGAVKAKTSEAPAAADGKMPDMCAGHENPAKQITSCTDFLDKNPKSAEAYNNRGFAFARINSTKEAIADFGLAVKFDPKFALAYNNLGIALRVSGRNDEAIKEFTKAIEIDPKYVTARVGRGISLMVKRDFDAAGKDFDEAIKIDPKFGAAYRNKGSMLVQQQRFAEAINYFNQALIQDISDADAYNNRGIAYEALRIYGVAIMNYKLALKYNPQLATAKTGLERLGAKP